MKTAGKQHKINDNLMLIQLIISEDSSLETALICYDRDRKPGTGQGIGMEWKYPLECESLLHRDKKSKV